MSDGFTASSTVSTTLTCLSLIGSAREGVRLYTSNGGYPSFSRYFWRLSAIARPARLADI